MTAAADNKLPLPLGRDALRGVAGGHPPIDGTHGADIINDGQGNDIVLAGRGDDIVMASSGDDSIDLGAGNDIAYAGLGADTVSGGTGEDQVYAEEGDDRIEGGAGDGKSDLLLGGEGNDTYVWAPGDGSDMIIESSGTDRIELVGVSFDTLQQLWRAGLFTGFNHPGFTMRLDGDVVTFHAADGSPISLDGHLQVEGETLSFSGIESFRLA
jgi:Ca2+-binding RTX toxin-like protein